MKEGVLPEIAGRPAATKSRAKACGDAEPMRGRLINARLLHLLAQIRKSGEITYRDRTGLVGLHQRMIALIGNYGPLASGELAALTGQEKAQISRAVRGLSASGLIHRASLRARITLSDAGEAVFEQFVAVARPRDEALRRGIDLGEIDGFVLQTCALIDRAVPLLAHERQLLEGAGGGTEVGEAVLEPPPMPARLGRAGRERPLDRMIVPLLITLTSYLKRSATLAYRRETGLSFFQWEVLSQVGEYDPITLAALIDIVGRHKSQVGRTVKRLEAEGILQRSSAQGRRDVVLNCTPRGAALYAIMCESARQRDDILCANITAQERAAYIATIAKLTENARAIAGGGSGSGGG